MPSGRYSVRGRSGEVVGTEDFRCAPGPMGWRYVSEIEREEPTLHRETVDVVVDASWRVVRARIETGAMRSSWSRGDGVLAGIRDGERIEVPWGPESHLDYLSPAFNAITAQRLTDTSGDRRRLPASRSRSIPSRCASATSSFAVRTSTRRAGKYFSAKWHYTALASGWESDLWVAEDVVVRYDRAFELISYERGATGPVLGRVGPHGPQPVLTASTSSSRSTVLLTRSPPVSRTMFQLTFQSSRSSVALADAERIVLP